MTNQEQLKAEMDKLCDYCGGSLIMTSYPSGNKYTEPEPEPCDNDLHDYTARILTAFNNYVDTCAPEKYEPKELPYSENTYEHAWNNAIDEFTASLKGEIHD